MEKSRFLICLFAVATVLYGCGAKPAMEGGQSDSSTEVGSVQEGASGETGKGDTTSFNDEKAEKVDEYVVRRGDNLWNIASHGSVYRSGWLYPLILKANRGKIKNAKDLRIGMTLKIPRGLPAADYEVAREEAMAGVYENEVGPLQEMKTDVPLASATAAEAKDQKAVAGAKGGGWKWFLWMLLIALAAIVGWQGWKMKMNRAKAQE